MSPLGRQVVTLCSRSGYRGLKPPGADSWHSGSKITRRPIRGTCSGRSRAAATPGSSHPKANSWQFVARDVARALPSPDPNGLHAPRRKLRLPNHDYSAPGAYFVTIQAQGFPEPFSEVVSGAMLLTEIGQIIARAWRWLAVRYPYVELDAFCVMLDHLHGILVIVDCGTTTGVLHETAEGARKSLGSLIGAFKTVSTKEVNRVRDTPGERMWQRSFYDHIVGDQHDMERIRRYIRANPAALTSPES